MKIVLIMSSFNCLGAFGEVRKAIHRVSGNHYAIKLIPVKNHDSDD